MTQQKFRRLKRPEREGDEDDSRKGGEDLFGDDEGAPPSDEGWGGEEGEGCMIEEGGESWVDEGSRGTFAVFHPEIQGLIEEVFGDCGAVMEILKGRRQRAPVEDIPKTKKQKTSPQTIEEGVVYGDDIILGDDEGTLTRVDQPERLCLRYRKRPVETSEAEIALEAAWLTTRLVTELAPDINLNPQSLLAKYKEKLGPQNSDYDPATTTVEQDMEQKIILVLDMLLNQRLEVPFILIHREHLISPPLDAKLVWMVYEYDQEWCRLRPLSLHLQKLLAAIPEPHPPIVQQLAYQLEHFRVG